MRLDIDANGIVTPEELKATIFYPDGPWIDDLADTIVNFLPHTIADAPR